VLRRFSFGNLNSIVDLGMQRVLIRQASSNDLPWIKTLLETNGLPIIGVEEWFGNFVVALDGKGNRVGVAGCELYKHAGLLRSVAVEEEYRNAGYARALLDVVLKNAKQKGVSLLYLFTNDAKGYFKRFGFEEVTREQMDEGVKASHEFTECCTSCTAMLKTL